MPARPAAAGRVLLAMAILANARAVAATERIMLDRALERAESDNQDIKSALAEVGAAEGRRVTAGTIAYNPELAAGLGPAFAFGGGQTRYESEVALSQRFELGGKRSNRMSAADSRLDVARLRLAWTRWRVQAQVRRVFRLGILARERLVATQQSEDVAKELAAAARERIELGAGTQLELNVAVAALGRARQERLSAAQRVRQLSADLGSVLAVPAGMELEPDGPLPDLPVLIAISGSEDEFVARALARRSDLAAEQRAVDAARADLSLARSLAVPDISVGATYGRSEVDATDTVIFGVSIPLPFWNRNQGGRIESGADLTRAQTVAEAARREAEREAKTVFRNYAQAREAVAGFDRDVIERLAQNLELARESFRSGKIGLLVFNVVRRDLLDTRLAFLDALAGLVEARYALDLASGGSVE